MTLDEIKSRVIFQANADEDDLDDYEPAITGYVNTGYDILLDALVSHHVGESPFVALSAGSDIPKLPEWTHDALSDYATYLIYRNGNPQKQSRGQAYLYAFNETLSKLQNLAANATIDEDGNIVIDRNGGKPPQFFNVY